MGEALVLQLAREGYTVGAVARRGDKLAALAKEMELEPGRVVPLAHDVTDTAGVQAAFTQLASEIENVELFVYAAGVMPEVGPTEYNTQKDLQQVAVNLGGAMA
ncbi:MAG: NADP-dependent 3-hydroxy acid dehydrogenase YdfG, partial [Planctomycetota bacterium]